MGIRPGVCLISRPGRSQIVGRSGLLALLVVAALVSGAGAASAARAASPSKLLGGVNLPGVYPDTPAQQIDGEISQAHALGAKLVRLQLPWSVFQPKGPGQVEPAALASSDRLLADAKAAGIRVIATVDSTPCWASSAPSSVLSSCGHGNGSANAWPPMPAMNSDYASFVAFLAARYGSGLAAIEIWNEPDQSNEQYFAGPDKPALYAALLRAAYPAIKAANPSVTVLAASIVGSNGVFLRLLYAAGIKGYYDALAVHFYTLTLGAVRSIRAVQLANGDSKPLWLDEFGWTSCWPAETTEQEQPCVTPQIQASNLADTFRALTRAPYVAAAVSYKLQDSASEDFGLLTAGGARKPSFGALAGAFAKPRGSAGGVSLSLRRKGRSVVASGSGPVGDFMSIEVFRGKLLRYSVLFTLDRFNRYSLTLPSSLGTKGLRVRVYQYWTGRGKATTKSI